MPRVAGFLAQRSASAIRIGTPMKAPAMPQSVPQKKTANSTMKGETEYRGAGDARLDVTADDELDDVEPDKHPDRRRERLVLGRSKKRGQQCGNERTDERDEIEDKGDHPPFAAEIETVECREGPEAEPGQDAHAKAHEHVGLQTAGNFRRGIDRGGAERSVADLPEAPAERLQLEQAEDHENEGHQGEGDDALQAAADAAQRADDPRHAELLGKQLGGVNAALLQALGGVGIEALQLRRIGDDPLRDPAETPNDQPAADADREQRHGGGEEDRDQLRQACLQPPLQRPDECNDEQGEGDRRHDAARQRQADEAEDGRADERREPQCAVAGMGRRTIGSHGRCDPAVSSTPYHHRGREQDGHGQQRQACDRPLP